MERISLHFISFHFISIHFISLHFTSLRRKAQSVYAYRILPCDTSSTSISNHRSAVLLVARGPSGWCLNVKLS